MAIRFDASGDYLSRTTNVLDYNAAYTLMGWVRLTSGAGGTWCVVWEMGRGAWANLDGIAVDDASPYEFMPYSDIGGSWWADQSSPISPSNGTWYHLALVRESATSLKMYVDGVQRASITADITGRLAATEMTVGDGTNRDSRMDGRVAYLKAWSAGLTAAEVQQEMQVILPRRTANLYGWWPTLPGATERARDYSGNGYSWTETGTLTDEDPPGVSWGAGGGWVSAAAAVAPSFRRTLAALGTRTGSRQVQRG